jgi:arylsulfatase A-like enzyme
MPNAAAWLRLQRYRTALFASGGDGVWECYCNLAEAVEGPDSGWEVGRDGHHPFWAKVGGRARFQNDDGQDRYLNRQAFEDMQRFILEPSPEERERPFYTLLWGYDTHDPYHAPAEDRWDVKFCPEAIRGTEREQGYRRFLSAIRATDRLIGELYDRLAVSGLADDTLIVVTGDHGEGFGQHGYFYHNHTLHEEEVRVPLVLINRPLAQCVGARLNSLGSHVDIWPTITNVLDIPVDPRWQGRSLFDAGRPARALISRSLEASVREDVGDKQFKYIWHHERREERLYDLATDPGERRNLAKEYPDYCRRQRRRLRDWAVFQKQLTEQRLLESAAR